MTGMESMNNDDSVTTNGINKFENNDDNEQVPYTTYIFIILLSKYG